MFYLFYFPFFFYFFCKNSSLNPYVKAYEHDIRPIQAFVTVILVGHPKVPTDIRARVTCPSPPDEVTV